MLNLMLKSRILLGFLSVMLLLAACGEGEPLPGEEGDRGDEPADASPVGDEEVVTLGLVSPLSGVVGPVGQAQMRGAELAVQHVNEDGGIMGREVRLVSRDTEGDPEVGIQAARDIVAQEGANLLLGVVSSGVALALPAVLEDQDAVLMTAAAHSNRITQGEDFSPNLFRITDNSRMRNYAGARIMAERYPEVVRWATLSPDYAYGHETWEDFIEELQRTKPDVEVVHEAWPQFGAADFRPHISSTLATDPQGVFSSLYSTDAITMSQQAQPFDLHGQIEVFVNPSNETDIPRALGEAQHPEWAGAHYYYEAFDNQMNDRFVADYEAEHGEYPTGYESEAYTAVWAYKHAIEEAGSSDTEAIIEALEGLTMDSVTGERTIRAEDHQTIKQVVWFRIEPSDEAPGWEVVDWVLTPGEDVVGDPNVSR